MTPADEHRHPGSPEETGRPDEDDALYRALAPLLACPGSPGRSLTVETSHRLAQACPPIAIGAGLRRRLEDQGARAARDLEFAAALAAERVRPSLGRYLAFLRGQAGLTVAEAARRYGFDFQFLGELERNQVRPQALPAARLAALVRRLKGSLEQLERLLPTTIQAPRTLAVDGRGALYRGARGARPADSQAASLAARGETGEQRENPDYQDERAAVDQLIDAVRQAWRR
jgi:transcriptional regulator with XRE-family HTH domain